MQDMIQVTVKLAGVAAEAVGSPALEYGVMPGAPLGSLISMLCAKYPRLGELSASLKFAVNGERCELDVALSDGDEIRVIPSFH